MLPVKVNEEFWILDEELLLKEREGPDVLDRNGSYWFAGLAIPCVCTNKLGVYRYYTAYSYMVSALQSVHERNERESRRREISDEIDIKLGKKKKTSSLFDF